MTTYSLEPLFLNYFFDTVTGDPLTGGTIEWFKSSDHSIHKSAYQTDVITAPATIPPEFDNPQTLIGIGYLPAIYYAEDESYYIELKRSDASLIKSIDNYPSSEGTEPPIVTEFDQTNYLLNPQYRFFIQQTFENDDLPQNEDTQVANDNWVFRRDNENGTNTIKFREFVLGQIDVPENPKYYLRYECTSIGVGGEGVKRIVFKIKDVAAFSGEEITISLQARSETNSSVDVVIIQDFGTGGTPSSAVETSTSIDLTSNWEQKFYTIVVPSVDGKSLGSNDDDKVSIGINLPLNQISIVDIVNWQLNKGDEILEFNYRTYEMTAINKRALQLPEITTEDTHLPIWVGDDGQSFFVYDEIVGTTTLDFSKYSASKKGYLLCDESTYQTDDLISGTKLSYRRLYNKIGNTYGYGTDGFASYLLGTGFSNYGIFRNTKQESIVDWTDNDTGFTFFTIIDGSTGIGFNAYFKENRTIQIENTAVGAVTDITAGTFPSTTATVITQGDGSTAEVSDLFVDSNVSGFVGGEYILISSSTTDYYVWVTVDGVGVDPAVVSRTGIMVNLSSLYDDATYIVLMIMYALNSFEHTSIKFNNASTLSGGEYFNFNSYLQQFYGWYTVDGVGTDPNVALKTGIKIELDSTDLASDVAQKSIDAISSIYFQVPDPRGALLRILDGGTGRDPDVLDRIPSVDMSFGINAVGTYQDDANKSHNHRIKCSDIEGDTSAPTNKFNGRDEGTRVYANDAQSGRLMNIDMVNNEGESDSRPKNVYVNCFIKY